MKFEIARTKEVLTPISGLACVGTLVDKTNLKTWLNKVKLHKPCGPDIKNGDIATSYIGLLCQGKNDFDDIDPFRNDKFFIMSMKNKNIPSSPTLRQRMDMTGNS